ncbi:MAG: toxin-antitoxin system YwqK family antitoxin [Planctomycetota bacterium]|jgi:antitoxin component YwqK of YwqJK toxin-antitoxin module|nr:toxin-antitoxin system YwqK family antitoxin [Planctomycetota bacterium]
MSGKTKKIIFAAGLLLVLPISAGWLFLPFANPQWHWRLYAWQAAGLPDGKLDPPPGYSGTWRQWTGDGRMIASYSYRNGERDGPYQTFDQAGRPLSTGQYAAGKLEGAQRVNHEDGTHAEIPYRGGKRDGVERTWFASGQVAVEAPWIADVQDGTVTFYHENGSIQAAMPFSCGEIEGVRRIWDENGLLQAEETFRGGRKSGPSVFFRPDGGVDMSLNYSDDVMDGVQAWFHPNGNKAREIRLTLGVPQGFWREWDEKGNLIVDEEYEKGELRRKDSPAP